MAHSCTSNRVNWFMNEWNVGAFSKLIFCGMDFDNYHARVVFHPGAFFHATFYHIILLEKTNSSHRIHKQNPHFFHAHPWSGMSICDLLQIASCMFHNNKIIFTLSTIILSLAMLGFTIVASSTIFSSTISLWRKVEKTTHLQIQVFHYL